MKQILQRRINNLQSTILHLDNKKTASVYQDKVDMLVEILKEYTTLKRIETLPKSSTDIKYILKIFGEIFNYTDDDLVTLMLVVTNFSEEELVDFLVEVRPPDLIDWKLANPDWQLKYFK